MPTNYLSSERIVRALFGVAVLLLPFSGAAGCGRSACFQWTAEEGACPAQSDAMTFFREPGCPSSISTVDSNGSFDGEFCCYAVTQEDIGVDFFEAPCVSSGAGGFGGSSNVGSGVTGVGGGGPPSPGCFECSAALFSGVPAKELCSFSLELFFALLNCACESSCIPSCQNDLCVGGSSSDECTACLGSSEECSLQLNECVNDFGGE